MTRDEQIALANRAKALLDDELVAGAFEALETEYIKGWRQTAARDTDARERLWQAVQVVGKIRAHLQTIVANGKLAQREIDDVAGQQAPRSIFG